jgi:Flp pilus assembly pilin Flp
MGEGVGLMGLRKFLSRFRNDETGQTTTEYILILAVVVMIALRFKGEFSKRILGIVDKLGTKIDTEIDKDLDSG